MRTLVIPDIHNKIQIVQKILDKENTVDEVVFLGDWFDDYNDTPQDVTQVAEYLNEITKQRNFIFLWGNHDMYYPPFRSFHVCASGYSVEKQWAINDVIKEETWEKFQFYQYSQKFLFTHAGVTSKNSWLFDRDSFNLDYFDSITAQAQFHYMSSQNHFMYRAGYSRGGMLPVGGITWCDYFEDFEPYSYLNQMFGHTICKEPAIEKTENSVNCCLDTNLKHYAIITDSDIEIITL